MASLMNNANLSSLRSPLYSLVALRFALCSSVTTNFQSTGVECVWRDGGWVTDIKVPMATNEGGGIDIKGTQVNMKKTMKF